MKKTLAYLLMLLCPTWAAASGAAVPQGDLSEEELPLAVVNDEPIVTADLARQLGRIHESVDQMDRTAFDTERLMFKLINDVLLGQEARSAGMAEEPEVVRQIDEYRDELVYKYLQKVEIDDRIEPEPEAVRTLFDQQYAEMQLRIITTDEKALAEATLAEIRDGADMAVLAGERSIDHIRGREGLMRPAPRIDLPRSIVQLAENLEIGELGGPVQTDLGWTIFRVEDKSEADPERFSTVEKTIRKIIMGERARDLQAGLAETARRKHEVVVDQERVDAMQPQRQPDGRLIAPAVEPEAVVARIGDERVVTAGTLAQALDKRWKGVRSVEAAQAAAPIILNGLIERQLLVAEGTRRGYGELPEVQALLHARETSLLIPLYLEEVIAAGIEVSPEEIEAFYEENKSRYLQPPRVRLGQVTVATSEEADKVAGMLRGGADMAWVAEQHSSDGFKDKGGLRDWMVLTPGLDQLQDMLLESEVGTVLDPIAAAGEFIVMKVAAREEQGPYPLQRISGNIQQAVFSEKLTDRLDKVISTLRERSEIVVFEERVQALNLSGSFVEAKEGEGAPGGHGH